MGQSSFQSELPMERLPYYALYEPTSESMKHTVRFNGLTQTGSFSIENPKMFSQVLMDQEGHYWFAEQLEPPKETTHLYVFNNDGSFLKSLSVSGRPNLFEFGDSVFAGCEGKDGKAIIYEFTRKNPTRVHQWTVEGFFWGMEKAGNRLYVSCYLSEQDVAVLYVIEGDEVSEVELGDHFFPTDLLSLEGMLYVAACPVLGDRGKKIIQLDQDLRIVREFTLTTSPRRLYSFDRELVIHALELVSEGREKLIYFDPKTGRQREYSIPHAHSVKGTRDRLFLVNLEAQSIIQWDHRKRKITKINRLPKNDNQHIVDFHCYQ